MKPKVLIVDDDPLMHLLYQRHLDQAGYQMISATDGNEALEIVARESPQIVIMDIMMSGMDGLSAIRQLKKADASKDIPVLVITAAVSALSATRSEAQNAGAADLLPKPFSPAQLLDAVRRLAPISPPEKLNP